MKLALVHLDMHEPDPSLGLAYIASYMRKYGNFSDIVIVDKEDHMKRIMKEKPDVVAISSLSHEFNIAKDLAEKIKSELNIPLIIGGYHVTLMPHHFNSTKFDIAVMLEGEQTMLELMQVFEKFGSFPAEELKKIKGIIYRENGEVKKTEPRPLIEPLDKIPYPARDLLKMEDYYMTLRASTFGKLGLYLPMMTSRGCPYKCIFCCNTHYWQRIRMNSPEYVVGEMKILIEKYKADGIIIFDDLFIANKQRVEKIVELMEKEGMNGKAEFHVYARANLINDEMCRLMKRMNVRIVEFGMESGSEKILKNLKTGNVTVADNRNALKMCKQYGFKTAGSFITGSPGETEEDFMMTRDLVLDENLDIAHVYQLVPLPGTEIWKLAVEKGVVSEDENFNYSQLLMRTFKENMNMSDMPTQRYKELYLKLYSEASAKRYRVDISHLASKIRLKHLKYALKPRFVKKVISHSKLGVEYLKNSVKSRN